jgi:hypothetical protein
MKNKTILLGALSAFADDVAPKVHITIYDQWVITCPAYQLELFASWQVVPASMYSKMLKPHMPISC